MPSYNPWRNPSERSHGIILRCIRVVHSESCAELKYWPFTAKTAAFVHNGLVTRSGRVKIPGTSPFFMKTGKNADFSKLRCMFCNMTCFVREERTPERLQLAADAAARSGDLQTTVEYANGTRQTIQLWDQFRAWDPGD